MVGLFHKTVSALCYDLVRGHDPAALPCNDVVRFVERQFARLPWFLAIPLRCATLWFALAGGPFHRLAPSERGRRIAAWQQAPLGALREVIRFYESLAVVALYSRREAVNTDAGRGNKHG